MGPTWPYRKPAIHDCVQNFPMQLTRPHVVVGQGHLSPSYAFLSPKGGNEFDSLSLSLSLSLLLIIDSSCNAPHLIFLTHHLFSIKRKMTSLLSTHIGSYTVQCIRFWGAMGLHQTYRCDFPLCLNRTLIVEGWELVYTKCGAPYQLSIVSLIM